MRLRFRTCPGRDEPLSAKLGDRLGDRVLGNVLVDNDANAAPLGGRSAAGGDPRGA